MCGIAGIISSFDKNSGDALIKKMLHVIEHRGPDSNGFWSTEDFAFGMQRLSIIDLKDGDQPIWSAEGVGIIFNGEIYNFKRLRESLEEHGVVFKTHSDTEVILQLYLKKGIEAIHDLEGMFGICLYDPRVDKVYLIRDRLGVKPLYYYTKDKTFIFGSEIKSILEVLPQKPLLNKESAWHYLTLRYVPSPNSIWQDIYKLEPGHFLEYNLKKREFKIESYWSLNFNSEKINKKRNYEKEFETLFLEAVEKRLLASDVPVGILLSGGLDSSCVAAAAVELGHKNFHTFSIGFEESGDFNELPFAKKVADHIVSNHHEIIISQKQFVDFLEDFVWYSDEPLADLASIPLYYVSNLASKHVKVVLSGEGADEILGGYHLDELAQKLFYLKAASIFPKAILKYLPYDSLKMLSQSGYSDFLKHTSSYITNVFSEKEKLDLCTFQGDQSTENYIQNLYKTCLSSEPLDQLQQAYCQSWLVEDLLMKADKMSMATSLELRVPFLDHKLVEWAETLPLEWKIGSRSKGFTTKRILRSFAEKRIPSEIINRPKQGFPVPAYKWLPHDLYNFAQFTLENPSLKKFFHEDKLSFLLTKLKERDANTAHKVWNLIIFSLWLKRWSA
ncbi:MAG: asparagine synthase (glutamine-hydrolyzing) [Alphaproteobacteria bacterium 16-39-46]|nr:MAG: asparagine synthase (glutamine-hydrolyzing) [Alphaproteobacteria bacterium 16-39-46]OZA44503.1 MAG: asparagine synthase (glutamine-hydrolyzing) [Alphaproteobacteria bacterium 17-39-52]HQS83350.1 asparagine synthase (glutamine-hydrolyzing) [Alphaproteobacteria bacterium]HQS93037.1 asparagine synthase (glutamine-hydrolyzing) [Alphaproteobacteria bacterium]